MLRVRTFVVIALLLPIAVAAQSPRPIVIRATTVLDGKGGVLRDVALVIQGSKIVRIDSNLFRSHLRLARPDGDARLDRHAHAHRPRTSIARPARSQPTVNETPQQSTFYAVENAYKTFMAGFTTIQSPGAEMTRTSATGSPTAAFRVRGSSRRCAPSPSAPAIPDEIRAFIRKAIADGADFVKIFATASIREGGAQTMTDEQIRAACDEANALGKRSIVHAQGPEGAKAAVLAGCTSIEHGNRLTDEVST